MTARLGTLAAISGATALALGALLTGCAGSAEDPDGPAVSGPAAGGDAGDSVTQPALGGQWVLVAGADADGAFVFPEEPSPNTPSVDFTGDGKVSGAGGCNAFDGTATDTPGEGATAPVEFGPLMSTKMACADEVANTLETRFLGALAAVDAYAVVDGGLILTGPDGVELDFDQAPNESQ